jgi:hypothetical protein
VPKVSNGEHTVVDDRITSLHVLAKTNAARVQQRAAVDVPPSRRVVWLARPDRKERLPTKF